MAYTRRQRLLLAIVPPLAALFIRVLGATLRYKDVFAEVAPDDPPIPIGITIPGPVVFAFWHRAMLVCAHRFRNKGIAILISPSFDGELIARTVALLGFLPVRGSSSRGAAGGLRNMAEAYNRGHRTAITADGPRGPNMVAKPGPVQLAQLTDAKWIGTYHAHPSRAWELNSWDRFMIPQPFATVTFAWPQHIIVDPANPAATLAAVQQALDEAARLATQS